jgi:hypothetical protein
VTDLLEVADRLAPGALGGRVGGDEHRVLGLDRPELVDQRVVLVVADLGVVEDVVAVAVMVELPAQLGGTGGDVVGRLGVGRFGAQDSLTSCAAGSTSRARS